MNGMSALRYRRFLGSPFVRQYCSAPLRRNRHPDGTALKSQSYRTIVDFSRIPVNMTNVTSAEEDDSLWKKFEFSKSPKLDKRFGKVVYNHTNQTELSKEDLLEQLHQQETVFDREYAKSIRRQNSAWTNLEPPTVQKAIACIQPYIQADRLQKIEMVLRRRTKNVRFLFENPSNPSNVFACLRTLDAFGIQNVDIVIQSNQYRGKAAIYQKRNMRTAMGSAKWLTVTNYETTEEAIQTIREQFHCRIYASDLSPTAVDIRKMDWTMRSETNAACQTQGSQPICIVMGNEDMGISDTMRALVDATFTLPMVGFAESFNLSVATAIVLAHLSASSYRQPASDAGEDGNGPEQRMEQWMGPLQPGDLSEHEYNCLYLKGLLHSLPQKRMAWPLLRHAGIELPKELNIA